MSNMTNQIAVSSHTTSISEAAVDGLRRGLPAGSGMLLYLFAASPTLNESPLVLLGRFARVEQTSPAFGFAAHMGMSAVYGILFMLLWRLIGRRVPRNIAPVVGIAYGIVLFLIAELILLPAGQSPLLQIPAIHWGIGQGIYGLVLGYLTGRK